MSERSNTVEITPERERVIALHAEGRSVRQIAAELRVSTQRIYQQLKALGLQPPSRR